MIGRTARVLHTLIGQPFGQIVRQAGHFYASTGPEIRDLVWDDTGLEIETSAVSSVALQGQSTEAITKHGTDMQRTRLEFGALAASPWLRVTVIDSSGRRAWTKPVWR